LAIRKKPATLPAVHVSSLLFICALMPALLYKGPQIEFFAITQIILVMWLGWVVLHAHTSGLRIPKTPLALSLTLFWAWLALSLTWSLAPSISVLNFWWVGSLVLVFWLYTLTPDRDVLWSHAAAIILVIGLVLALMGIYQALVQDQQARSVFETRNTHAAFLNLVALPASAYFLQATTLKAMPRRQSFILGLVLFVLFLSVFLSASRGAALSLGISVGLLAALTFRSVSRRSLWLLLGLLAVAFLSTKYSHGELGERLVQMTQDTPRHLIWESSWNLLQAAPWQGIGLGLFYLAYTAYRNPQDVSGGFFAHNDYLQIWIETGLPGLILLLAVLLSALWLFARALRKTKWRGDAHVEMTGLFCGLMAVAGHSVVDFNLYILSIMILSGLAMGRLHELLARELRLPSLVLRPSRIVGKQAYPIIVLLLVLLPVFYFVALGAANSYYDKGLALAREGKLKEADERLAIAHRLTPADDRMLIAHADLYRHAITLLPEKEEAAKDRKALYEDARQFLEEAKSANALRAITHIILGRLYQENLELAGDSGFELAAKSFRRGLTLNPRLFQGRTEYAELLLQHGNRQQALETLDEGAKYEYFPVPELVPFYRLTAKLRREVGRVGEAFVLENKVQQLEKQTQGGYFLRGY